jgi:hypothetical protein
VSQEQLKVTAIILALVSLTLLAIAAGDWSSARAKAEDPTERSGCQGNLILLVVSLLLVGTLWMVAGELGWSRDRVLWTGLGGFLAVMTLTRPWWFWENYRARWLRDVIGDEVTAFLYLALSAVMVWVGLFTDWTVGRQ